MANFVLKKKKKTSNFIKKKNGQLFVWLKLNNQLDRISRKYLFSSKLIYPC